MLVKRNCFEIEYDENLTYIPKVIEYLESKMKDIMDFFELKSITPRKIVIYNDLETYKKQFERFGRYRDYVCADTNDGNINLLSLEAAHQTKTHANMSLEELKMTISHEFVHICQQEAEVEPEKIEVVWFWEALATNLGNPSMFRKIEIEESNDEIANFSSLKNNYLIAFTIGNYLLENYSHDQILEYVRFPKRLINDSSDILDKAKGWSIKTKI